MLGTESRLYIMGETFSAVDRAMMVDLTPSTLLWNVRKDARRANVERVRFAITLIVKAIPLPEADLSVAEHAARDQDYPQPAPGE